MSGERRSDRRRSRGGRGTRRRPAHRSKGWRGPLVGGLLAMPVGLALAAAMIVTSSPEAGTPTAANGAEQGGSALPDDAQAPEDFFPSPSGGAPAAPTRSPAAPVAGTGDGAKVKASASPSDKPADDASENPSDGSGGDGGSGGGGNGGGSSTMSALAEKVVELTNDERAQAGCSALRPDSRLTAAAQGHSEDMNARDYMDHTGPDGRGPGDRAAAQGYNAWSGENIAAGQQTAASVVEAWMNSEGHRANILNCDSKAIGVGESGRKWTQMFGRE